MLPKTTIIESAKSNHGTRTMLRCFISPYETVFSHYHTLFNEIFEVMDDGDIDVWNGFGKVHLEKGQTLSIEKNTLHHYVAGSKGAEVIITIEPGSVDYENAVHITNGLHQHGIDFGLETIEKNNLAFMAIIAELTNSNALAENKKQIDNLRNSEEGELIEALKKEWLHKYCL